MKEASRLARKLRPFVHGKRLRLFSEVEPLLIELLEYLEENPNPPQQFEDPTIMGQMELPLENAPKPDRMRFRLLEE